MEINKVELKEFPETEIMMNEWKCPKCGHRNLEEQSVIEVCCNACCKGMEEPIEMEEQDLALLGQRYETPKGESVWIFF